MKLSRDNYEAYLVDYLDGQLSPLQVAELLLFLEQNPDIKSEFEGIEEFSMNENSEIKYPYKDLLKKNTSPISINASSIEHFLIRKIENDLSEEEQTQLTKYLQQNKSAHSELITFEKTILKPDMTIVFPEKNSLKKEAKIIPLFYRIASVAAIFLLLVSSPYFFKLLTNNNKETEQVASNQIKTAPKLDFNENMSTNSTNSTSVIPTPIKTKINKQKAVKNTTRISIQINDLQPSFVQTNSNMDSLTNQIVNQIAAQVPQKEQSKEFNMADNASREEVVPDVPSETPHYLSLKDIAEKKIKDLSKDNLEELNAKGTKKHKSISAWDFAAIAAKLVGKISGNSIKLQNKYNSEGELTQYAIVSNNFEFSKGK